MNSSSNNTDILTNLGLTNNHLSPLRKNNTLLDRPEVKAPVRKIKNLFILILKKYFYKLLLNIPGKQFIRCDKDI